MSNSETRAAGMLNVVLIYASQQQRLLVTKALESHDLCVLLEELDLAQWKEILRIDSEPELLLLSTGENPELGRRIIGDVRRLFPDIAILLLEREFPYAFLNSLMPLSIDGIVRQSDVGGELLESIGIASQKKRLEKQYGQKERDQNHNLLRANAVYLRQMLQSADNSEAVESFLNVNRIKRDQTACVAEIWLRDVAASVETEQIRQTMDNILEHLVNRFYIGYTFYCTWEFSIHRVICLFWYKSTNTYGLFTVDGIYRMMLDMLKRENRDYVFMGVSQYDAVGTVKELYHQAHTASQCYFWNQEKDILYYSRMGKYLPVKPPACNGVLYQIASILRGEEKDFAGDTLPTDRLMDLCAQIRYDRDDTLRCLQYFIGNYVWRNTGSGPPVDGSLYAEADKMQSMVSAEEIRMHVKTMVSAFQKEPEPPEKGNALAVKARRILEQRYGENLSLLQLAEQLGVSPNYLGVVIKKEYSRSFSELLACIRVEKAKKLLYDNRLTIHEIAREVGIPNDSYFCTVFKRVTGKSPRSFMRS